MKPLQNPKNNPLVLGFSPFQPQTTQTNLNKHKHPTQTALFQASLCPFRQQWAQ
ncbi:hypothetical protein ACKLNO_11200 [Neisseriaceae bacterium B1]